MHYLKKQSGEIMKKNAILKYFYMSKKINSKKLRILQNSILSITKKARTLKKINNTQKTLEKAAMLIKNISLNFCIRTIQNTQ